MAAPAPHTPAAACARRPPPHRRVPPSPDPAAPPALQVVEWVEDICGDWDFRQVVPCHFEAPVKAGPAEFRRAFAFAYEQVRAFALRGETDT